jgi:hypothetical protein
MPARLAVGVLGIAFAAILTALIVSLSLKGGLDKSSDVADVVVAVVASISTVVVAFFGIHVAEAGRRDAEDARARSEQLHLFEQGRVRRLASAEDARQRAAILDEDPPEALSRK